jgi:hypothetical protein
MNCIGRLSLSLAAFALWSSGIAPAFADPSCTDALQRHVVGSCATHPPADLSAPDLCEWAPGSIADKEFKPITDRWNPDPLESDQLSDKSTSWYTILGGRLHGSFAAPEETKSAAIIVGVGGSLACSAITVLLDQGTSVSSINDEEDCLVWGVQEQRLHEDRQGPVLSRLIHDEEADPDVGHTDRYRLRVSPAKAPSKGDLFVIGYDLISSTPCTFGE